MILPAHISELAAKLGASLTNKKLWITTAESCTGGGISYALTDTAGSSAYIDRCFVTYSNDAKHELLGVKQEILEQFGAVSKETIEQMADGAINVTNADVAIAVSGIAGPGGGTKDKPVGTVWIAVKVLDKLSVEHCLFTGNRSEVRLQVIEYSLKKAIELIN
ncbi:CinA family protein [Pseudoalteromonas sp. T1lg24]|uniref:CinA family protein n=1 Tax=Pseudoalteromonas sp. T1lg24 TaxID=2077099 RepID=UPI000CF73A6F|nr:nicotinamide-nucleotide amidohydrolase family protein [Pseudoalteromonas sp. T1lg24]